MSRETRLAMIDRTDDRVSLVRQCGLVGISRSSIYYQAKAADPGTLELMRRIDEQYLKTPFYGSRKMTAWLREQGYVVGRDRVRRLMRLLGLETIYQKPRTSRPHPAHRIYPYLLRGLAIMRPSQVWCADVCYIPMARGFVYLVAIMDWFSRYVLSWRLSVSLPPTSASRRSRRRWRAMASPRSSTPIRAPSLPARPSLACCRQPGSRSAWTAGAAAWTTSSSSASGVR
jgi:hypothetical protein